MAPGAFLHYGVKLGDNVVIDLESFVMKGASADSNTIWRGNPAKMIAGAATARNGCDSPSHTPVAAALGSESDQSCYDSNWQKLPIIID